MAVQQRVLWRHVGFLKLWAGQTISEFGSGVTYNALPLAAVLTLGASTTQLGLLMAAASAPAVFAGLFAGVWVDRLQRRPLLIAADLARAALIASIPVAALLGRLHAAQLYVVAALAGVLTILFDVAYQAFVPDLVSRAHIQEANGRLATSGALAEVVTPGLTGVLVQVLTAPLALALDAISYLCSAVSLALIRVDESAPAPRAARARLGPELLVGLRFVAGEPLLRAFAGFAATRSFFGNFIGALYALYALRELGLNPVLLGVTIGVGGASNLLGTFLVGPVTRRFGLGRAMLGSVVIGGLTSFFLPLAHGPLPLAFGCLVLLQAFDATQPIYEVNALSLRQALTPPHLLGRVNAAVQVLEGAPAPLGAIVGGALGGIIGPRATLLLAVLGLLASTLWLLRSPLWALRTLPEINAVGRPPASPLDRGEIAGRG